MQIVLEISSIKDLEILLPLLKRLQIPFFKQRDTQADKETPLQPIQSLSEFWGEEETGPDAHLRHLAEERGGDTTYVPHHKSQKWDFNKFYGSAKSEMTFDEIEQKLNEHRQEWNRDTL